MEVDELREDTPPGTIVDGRGYFTHALYVRGQPASEIAHRLGYGPGRFDDGWWLLFLIKRPGPTDFTFAGYTYFSDGVEQGHLANPPDPRRMDDRLREDGIDLLDARKGAADRFKLSGPWRLAKVVPRRRGTEYPPGSGFPQWRLETHRPWFALVDFIAPGNVYDGDYRLPGE